jgi:hypothetical protein
MMFVKKNFWLMAVIAAMSINIDTVYAATPVGFSNTTLTVTAEVGVSCEETQHGEFPAPLLIDTQVVGDQTFAPIADELVSCTNGIVFTIKVSSANGTALDQTCTSNGVSGMSLKSASWPTDEVPYIFTCAGDTNGSGNFTGAGFASPRALGIGIKVLAADAQAALAHNDYSDTVTLTISY